MIRILLAALLLPVAALAAPQRGCPPLGALPDFTPEDSRLRSYERMEFRKKVEGSEEGEVVEPAGRTCTTVYALKAGKDEPSNLEIQMNYRQQLEQMGAVITGVGGRDLYARLVKDGVETWLRVYGDGSAVYLYTLAVLPPKVTLLPASGNDYKLVGHLPDYVSDKPVVRTFDKMAFTVVDGDAEKEVEAQGRTVRVGYTLREGKVPLSNAEIQFNYIEALRAQGAEILRSGGREVTARLLSAGQVVWIKVYAEETSLEVSVVEEKPFEPVIKPVQAQLQDALGKTGRVALYVNFDFDKATLRPDAAAVVAQVVAMLKADPKLRLVVEGHTDGLGTSERNAKLSADRAASFAAAVVAGGVAAERLSSAGFGAGKPVATNDTSDGRARNRRVELVRQ